MIITLIAVLVQSLNPVQLLAIPVDYSTPASLSFTISWSLLKLVSTEGLPGGSDGKKSTCSAGDLGSIPGLGRSLGGGHGNPL